jgi:hypothetical protein
MKVNLKTKRLFTVRLEDHVVRDLKLLSVDLEKPISDLLSLRRPRSNRLSQASQLSHSLRLTRRKVSKMDLPISVFEIMNEIAKDNKIRGTKWARASGLSPSRISDFKRMAKQTKAGAAESDEQRKRTSLIVAGA